MILAARSPSSVQMACSSKLGITLHSTNYVRDEGRLCHSAKAPQTGAETVRGPGRGRSRRKGKLATATTIEK